ATSSSPLEIGGDSLYGQNFGGVIDEVRIYSIALTESQIQADMNTSLSGAGPGGAAATLSASVLSFNNQLVGVASNPQTVTLTNTGAIAMALGGITVSGVEAAEFTQNNNCESLLQAGAHC